MKETTTRLKTSQVSDGLMVMAESESKRRRKAAEIDVGLLDLPNALLAHAAGYLPAVSRALFALALTAPTFSWRERRWNRRPSAAGRAVLFVRGRVVALDFGDVEEALAGKMTDDHLCGILVATGARDGLRTLRLRGCTRVRGWGLQPLYGSHALEHIDLSLVGLHEDPNIQPEPSIDEDAVLPILESIVSIHHTRGCSLKYFHLPKAWRNRQSKELGHFLDSFHNMMEQRGQPCSVCREVVDTESIRSSWFVGGRDDFNTAWSEKWYGTQEWTCSKCLCFICHHHEGNDEDNYLNHCSACERVYCKSCTGGWRYCDRGMHYVCKECTDISVLVCKTCGIDVCTTCAQTLCGEGKCAREISVEGCGVSDANGRYKLESDYDETSWYVRKVKGTIYSMYRLRDQYTARRRWCISISDHGSGYPDGRRDTELYRAAANDSCGSLPPVRGWACFLDPEGMSAPAPSSVSPVYE